MSFSPQPLQVVLVVKNLPANAGDARDAGLILGSGRSPGGGNDNPLQCSYLEKPVDRGAWWVTLHGVAKRQTRLDRSTHTHTSVENHGTFAGSYFKDYFIKILIFPTRFGRDSQQLSSLVGLI